MSGAGEEVRIRQMNEADLDRVMEIAEGLKDAPHWTRAAYRAAMDAGGVRRVALVAEELGAGAKAHADLQLDSAELKPPQRLRPVAGDPGKSCHDTKLAQGEVFQESVKPGADREQESFGRVVVGFAGASVVLPEAELETIVVAREWQRRGVARRLFAALVEELSAAGVQDVHLEVRGSNGAAMGFYRTLGFVEMGRRRGYYADPVEDAVLFRLKLD
jgi:ribosomal-protein-alanine acetyltransferase